MRRITQPLLLSGIRCALACMIVALFFTGCSGGTVGTSSTRPARISGKVVTENGESVSDVEVVVLETGDGSRTNSDGTFDIETTAVDGNASLLVESSEVSSSVNIGAIEEDSSVILELVLSQSGAVSIQSITVESLADPEPEPTETPDSADADSRSPDSGTQGSQSDSSMVKEPLSIVTGVVSSNTGVPLGGIRVRISQRRGYQGSDRSGGNGKFSVEGPFEADETEITLFENGVELGKAVILIPRRAVRVEVNLTVVVTPGQGVVGLDTTTVLASSVKVTRRK